MTTWDPHQYLRFEQHRLRPAVELLLRIEVDRPRRVVDLGCGTGNTTALLADRWPHAVVTGVDSSAEMLDRARHDRTDLEWVEADLASWEAHAPVDVIYANAALHWVPDHAALLPHLVAQLAPAGVLAVQMPRNWDEPSHTLIAETARTGRWSDRLQPLLWGSPVADPAWYLELLAPLVKAVDVWTTTYHQVLDGDHAVAEWTRGTALRPFLDALEPDEAAAFFATYARRTAAAYPPRDDGTTVLPFTRLFIVATAASDTAGRNELR